MDSYNLKQYIKSLRQKDTIVAVAAGFVSVFAVASLLLFLVLRPTTPEIASQPEPTVLTSLSTLPTTVSYEEQDGQKVPTGLPVEYVVQPGDSTWKIAMAFYGSGLNYVDIERANNLQPDQYLMAGQKLVIPKTTVRDDSFIAQSDTTPELTTNSSESVTETEFDDSWITTPSTPTVVTYTIKPGDSLWKIAAAQLGDAYRWPELYQLNRSQIGANPDLIYPDVVLTLPTK